LSMSTSSACIFFSGFKVISFGSMNGVARASIRGSCAKLSRPTRCRPASPRGELRDHGLLAPGHSSILIGHYRNQRGYQEVGASGRRLIRASSVANGKWDRGPDSRSQETARTLALQRTSGIQSLPQRCVPSGDAPQEKFKRCPVAPSHFKLPADSWAFELQDLGLILGIVRPSL